MNFQTILEELDRLYEEDAKKETEQKEQKQQKEQKETKQTESAADETEKKELTEAAEEVSDDEEIDDEIIDDEEPAADEPKQLILECDKCGALAIKNESDVKIDEATDLANVEEVCPFCEETAGCKIVGVVAPYETAEDVELVEAEIEEEGLEEGIAQSVKDTLDTMKTIGQKVVFEYKAFECVSKGKKFKVVGPQGEVSQWVGTIEEAESLLADMAKDYGLDYWADKKNGLVKFADKSKNGVEEGLFGKKNKGTKEIKASELKKGDILVGRFGDDTRQDKVVSVTDDGESVEVRYKGGGGFMPKDEIVTIRESLKETDGSDMEEGLFDKKNKGTVKEVKATDLKKGNTLLLVGSEDKVTGVTDEGGSHISVSLKHGTVAIPRNHIVTIKE